MRGEFAIGGVVTRLIEDELKRLDGEGKLTDNHLSLFEKFVGG